MEVGSERGAGKKTWVLRKEKSWCVERTKRDFEELDEIYLENSHSIAQIYDTLLRCQTLF